MDTALSALLIEIERGEHENLSFDAFLGSSQPSTELLKLIDTQIRPLLVRHCNHSDASADIATTTAAALQQILPVLQESLRRVKLNSMSTSSTGTESETLFGGGDELTTTTPADEPKQTFSWLDFEDDGPLPSNPWEAVPNAIAALRNNISDSVICVDGDGDGGGESSPEKKKLKALEDISEVQADEVATEHWRELLGLLKNHLMPHKYVAPATTTTTTTTTASPTPDSAGSSEEQPSSSSSSSSVLLAIEVINAHFRLFQSAAPKQAADLLLNVLSAISVKELGGIGAASSFSQSSSPVMWRLYRCANFMLSRIPDHFRFLPDQSTEAIVVSTFALLASSNEFTNMPRVTSMDEDGDDGHRRSSTDVPSSDTMAGADSSAAEATAAPAAVMTPCFRDALALLDPDAYWFLDWCRRVGAGTVGKLLVASSPPQTPLSPAAGGAAAAAAASGAAAGAYDLPMSVSLGDSTTDGGGSSLLASLLRRSQGHDTRRTRQDTLPAARTTGRTTGTPPTAVTIGELNGDGVAAVDAGLGSSSALSSLHHHKRQQLHLTMCLLAHAAVFHHSFFARTPSILTPTPPSLSSSSPSPSPSSSSSSSSSSSPLSVPSALTDVLTELSHHFLWSTLLTSHLIPQSTQASFGGGASNCRHDDDDDGGGERRSDSTDHNKEEYVCKTQACEEESSSRSSSVSSVCCEALVSLAAVRPCEVLEVIVGPLLQVAKGLKVVGQTQQLEKGSEPQTASAPAGAGGIGGLDTRLSLLTPFLHRIFVAALGAHGNFNFNSNFNSKRLIARLLRSPPLVHILLLQEFSHPSGHHHNPSTKKNQTPTNNNSPWEFSKALAATVGVACCRHGAKEGGTNKSGRSGTDYCDDDNDSDELEDEEKDDRTICDSLQLLFSHNYMAQATPPPHPSSPQLRSPPFPPSSSLPPALLDTMSELAGTTTGLLCLPSECVAPCVDRLCSRFLKHHHAHLILEQGGPKTARRSDSSKSSKSSKSGDGGCDEDAESGESWSTRDRLLLVKLCELPQGYRAVATSPLVSYLSSSCVLSEDDDHHHHHTPSVVQSCLDLLLALAASPFLAADLCAANPSLLASTVRQCAAIVAARAAPASNTDTATNLTADAAVLQPTPVSSTDNGQHGWSAERKRGEVRAEDDAWLFMAIEVVTAASSELNSAIVLRDRVPDLALLLLHPPPSSGVLEVVDPCSQALVFLRSLLSVAWQAADNANTYSLTIAAAAAAAAAGGGGGGGRGNGGMAVADTVGSSVSPSAGEGYVPPSAGEGSSLSAREAVAAGSEYWRNLVTLSTHWKGNTMGGDGGGEVVLCSSDDGSSEAVGTRSSSVGDAHSSPTLSKEGGGGGVVNWLAVAVFRLVKSPAAAAPMVIHLEKSRRAHLFLHSTRGILFCVSLVENLAAKELPHLLNALALSRGTPLSAIVAPWFRYCFANLLCLTPLSLSTPSQLSLPHTKQQPLSSTSPSSLSGSIATTATTTATLSNTDTATATLLRDGVGGAVLTALALLHLLSPALVRDAVHHGEGTGLLLVRLFLAPEGQQAVAELGISTAVGAALMGRLEVAHAPWISAMLDREKMD